MAQGVLVRVRGACLFCKNAASGSDQSHPAAAFAKGIAVNKLMMIVAAALVFALAAAFAWNVASRRAAMAEDPE